ncbi:PREDICTED: pentatricopeptide repeat-containing protein At5g47360 [Camelina sativa]|uniref:Pentatricopeptide repeat-containing protein At5g47360 n=1 Tax=Camelina sativa TaxID=90675 RepID=A0ABM0XEI6_CAMSA|nr:PREDICTED: pentatricopeptide repeat-containing protein At5g47360 [Camelina sativa]
MLSHLKSRLVSPSLRSHPSKISALRFSTTGSAAERLYDQLQGCTTNLEKQLASAKVKLDSSCINEVIRRCHPNQFQSGLRFFIWAGTQSSHRHSPFMYSKACDFLKIRANPGLIKDVVEAYRKEECFVSVKTMRVVLTLCNQAKLADEALWVLRKFPEFDLCADTVAYNLVIRLFADKGDLNMADMLMKEMDCVDLYPDVITYTSVINGYCNAGMIDEAWMLAKEMSKHDCVLNTVTYSRILEGVCKFGSMEAALELLSEMEKEDGGGSISPNAVTYTLVIQAFCEKKRIREALLVLDRMGDRGCTPNRVTASVLIQGVLENDEDVKDLSKLIDKLVKLGGVSLSECFSSATVSLIRLQRWGEAEKIFRLMLFRGIGPDGLACSLVLRELCLSERFLDCFLVYQEIEKADVKSTIDSDIHANLLLGLCKQGSSWEAAKLAKLMLDKKLRLRVSHVDKIIEALKKTGDEDLMRRFSTD